MNRKEVYAFLKEHNLIEEVQNRYGENYTRVSTAKLEQVIWDYDASMTDRDPDGADTTETQETTEVQETTEAPVTVVYTDTTVEDTFEAACIAFVGILKDTGKLDYILSKL